MSSDYLRTYAQSADANTLADAAPLTALQKKLLAQVDERGVTWAERAFQHDRDASQCGGRTGKQVRVAAFEQAYFGLVQQLRPPEHTQRQQQGWQAKAHGQEGLAHHHEIGRAHV